MGVMVSARWVTGDDDAVVIVMSSSSLHRCHERKGRAGQSSHEDGVTITMLSSSPMSTRGGQTRAKWASSHDDGMMIMTERLSRRRRHCIAVVSTRGGRARARCMSSHDDNATIATALVTPSLSPHCCWKCVGEGGERASVRARAMQCAEVGVTVSAKAGRRVNVRVVVQGNCGKDEGKRVRQHRCMHARARRAGV